MRKLKKSCKQFYFIPRKVFKHCRAKRTTPKRCALSDECAKSKRHHHHHQQQSKATAAAEAQLTRATKAEAAKSKQNSNILKNTQTKLNSKPNTNML